MRPLEAPGRRRPRPTAVVGAAAIAATLSILVSSCAGDAGGSAAPPAPSRPVAFPASDGVRLAGRLFLPDGSAEGTPGVVLSHMLPADQRSWYPFAGRLADEGYSALTFDFRGYCPGGVGGCSQGDKQISAIWQDVAGAATFLRGQGVSSVSLVGASMGGTASIVAAGGGAPPAGPVASVITLSAPVSMEGLSATPESLLSIQGTKLFVAALGDGVAADAAQQLYREASAPKRVEIVPADGHGTDMLSESRGEEVQRLIISTLDTATARTPA
jgi:dienelactone hydrolase